MKNNSKIALITGAGSGIGKSVALALYKEGYSVVLAGRKLEKLEETAKAIGKKNGRILIIPTDVTDPLAVQNLFSKIKEKYGRLDVVFNNAGVGSFAGLLEDIPFDQWKKVIETNITGVFLCTQEAFKLMKSQVPMGGRIINNGSISSQVPRPNSAPYTAAKHAVTGLTKSTSLDGRKYNIACGQIDIGNALTEMVTQMTKGIQQANGTMAIEPTMPVEDVASAVVYMAGLPLESNVLFMTVMATAMPFVGRG